MQEARTIVPKLLECIHQLPACKASGKSLVKLQTSLALLFSNLYKIICINQLTDAARHDISQACKEVVATAVTGEAQTRAINADLQTAIRGALRVPYNSSINLPLTPQHSAELLSWLVTRYMWPARDLPSSSSQTVVLLLAARLYKVAARDSKLFDVHVAQQLAAVASRSASDSSCNSLLFHACWLAKHQELSAASYLLQKSTAVSVAQLPLYCCFCCC